jgi:hypothetical protein
VKGIGTNKRADLLVEVRKKASLYRTQKLKEQDAISDRVTESDVIELEVQDDRFGEPASRKNVKVYWPDGCLALRRRIYRLRPEARDQWWEVVHVGRASREIAEYVGYLMASCKDYELAADAVRKGLSLTEMRAVIHAIEEEGYDAGERLLKGLASAAGS